MSLWIYFLGEDTGADIKIGYTSRPTVQTRVEEVNGDQTTAHRYRCLAAVVGDRKDETALKRGFAPLHIPKGRKTEYFRPEPELVEYVAWLRGQYWTSLGDDDRERWEHLPPEVWMPALGRAMPRPVPDPDKMVQDWETLTGPLNGTPWSWMPNPTASFQDFFTPPEIVAAAGIGMGGIDSDAASHWAANRKHRIAHYFHAGYSAFEHDWKPKVWLNPPYGDNAPWWTKILEQLDAGNLEQICILSPMWSFTTQIARPIMDRMSAMLLLSPTPDFWGNAEGLTGKKHPHAIVYIGDRPREVMAALSEFGFPIRLEL